MATGQEKRTADRIAEGRKALGLTPEGKPRPIREDPPVYDERGNVRPRGTEGAKPMTYDERVAIAKRLAKGERIVTTAEKKTAPKPAKSG